MRHFLAFFTCIILCVATFSCITTKIVEEEVPAEVPERLITDFQVMDEMNVHNWALLENVRLGDLLFGDRHYLITSLPEAYWGLDWIRTACESKKFTGETLVSFTVNADVTVFIAFDDRIDRKPDWFAGFKDTGDDLVDSETSPVTLSIFGKDFSKGSVVALGPNSQSGGCIQYTIFVMDSNNTKSKISYVTLRPEDQLPPRVAWADVTNMPVEWYKTEEALRMGDNVLLYQRNTGGWPRNIDMSVMLNPKTVGDLTQAKDIVTDSTIDNDATLYQIAFLARVYSGSAEERYKTGALAGLEYLLKAQYPNGGWPQVYPLATGDDYSKNITYKNNAMINVMGLFSRILKNDPVFAFAAQDLRTRLMTALDKGVECILASQIKINGKLTVWCTQHDPGTLAPVTGRAYELPSLSGLESVGIVHYLMRIENPSPAVVNAVQAAVAWFAQAKIEGIRIVEKEVPALSPPKDIIVVADPSALPLWARFYDLKTGKPFFCSRDGVKKAALAEIEHERRIGDSFYTSEPAELLTNVYPEWQTRYAPETNVLK